MNRFFPFLPLACFGLILTSCQAPSPAPEPEVDATAEEIVDVVQDLFQAMEALFTSVNLTGDAPTTRRTEGSTFASSVGQPGVPYIERMYDPVVEHHGDFAHLWAFYDFSLGDSLSHCGHDAIQLVRDGGQWRILGITYTRTACP